MKCPTCRGEMSVRVEASYSYKECGLDNVQLKGVRVSECPNGHEPIVSLPRLAELHQMLAKAVASKHGKLTGSEVRFLRKHLGWSGIDFAARMGVDAATVSRWEHDKDAVGAPAERAIRLMAMHGHPVEEYPLELLSDIAQPGAVDPPFEFVAGKSGWKTAA